MVPSSPDFKFSTNLIKLHNSLEIWNVNSRRFLWKNALSFHILLHFTSFPLRAVSLLRLNKRSVTSEI